MLPTQLIRLEEDEVMFFQTTPLPIANADQRLAIAELAEAASMKQAFENLKPPLGRNGNN